MTLLLGRGHKGDCEVLGNFGRRSPGQRRCICYLVISSLARTWYNFSHGLWEDIGWSHNNALQLATSLQVDAVLEAIDETAHVLVLVDACHSGFLAYRLISRLP